MKKIGRGFMKIYCGYDKWDNEFYEKRKIADIYVVEKAGWKLYFGIHKGLCKKKSVWDVSELTAGMNLRVVIGSHKSKESALQATRDFIDKVGVGKFFLGIWRGQGIIKLLGRFPLNDVTKWQKKEQKEE